MLSRRSFVALSATAGILTAFGGLTGCAGGSESTKPDASSGSEAEASDREASSASDETASVQAKGALVVCFSATGNTRAVAKTLSDALGADFFEIEPAQPYTPEDLNYNDDATRATVEQSEGTARPEIAGDMPDWGAYDTVLVGHPIWWGEVPRIMCTLFEQHADVLATKKIADFCTSGSSGITAATDELQAIVPAAQWGMGRRFEAGASADEVSSWARSLGFGVE